MHEKLYIIKKKYVHFILLNKNKVLKEKLMECKAEMETIVNCD